MWDTALKLIAEQALNSRPALERPITHAKYGALGAIAAGLSIAAGSGLLVTALYVWLIGAGVPQHIVLLLSGLVLLLNAVFVWWLCRRMTVRELEAQARERAQEEAAHAPADMASLLAVLAQEVAHGFAEGLASGREKSARESREPSDYAPPGQQD
ncbi:hypothetical protein [Kordiimonas sp.]|uniref:hypothetical protein n=1 Tax=Kordiimonas sp. TaxID=1970157 RepID=UPI003A92EFE7